MTSGRGASDSSSDEAESFESDLDRQTILARRNLFLLVAVASLANASACGGKVQYDTDPIATGGARPATGGASTYPTTPLTGGANSTGTSSAMGGSGGVNSAGVGGWATVGGTGFDTSTGGYESCAGCAGCEGCGGP